MKNLTLLILFMFQTALAQTGSEIYLADLKLKRKELGIANMRNVTNRAGYDNQPYFHPGQPLVYYSSFNEEGRADIKIYNFKTGKTSVFTQTREREYSPIVTPDNEFISCIIQRDSGAQDLGKYPVAGGQPVVLISDLIVGYHCWVDETRVLIFVLGQPNTLRLYDLKAKSNIILTENVGRALHTVPGEKTFSFVHKLSESEWVIKKCDPSTGKISPITNTLPGREDITWSPDGKIITSDGTGLFYFQPGVSQKWELFYSGELKGITRLAVSPNGKSIAIVVSE